MELFNYDPKTKVDTVINSIDRKTYFVYNISKGKENYSQLRSIYSFQNGDFKTDKYSFCNVTTMGMALDYLGYIDFLGKRLDNIYPELPRLPDKLAKFMLEDPRVLDFYNTNFKGCYNLFKEGNKDALGPNEIHTILSYATNLMLGIGNVTYFSTNTSWIDIVEDVVYNNLPIGISGKFSGLNHIVLMVGAAYKELSEGNRPSLLQKPDYIIVDDPYGKTYEYSKGLSGNDIWIPFAKCVEDFKSVDNPYFKFAHRFIKPDFMGLK